MDPLFWQARTIAIISVCALRRRAIVAMCRRRKSSASVDPEAEISCK